jgi:hypothetical protein
MAKNDLWDFDETDDNNEDIGGIDIRGTAKVSNFDNAFRKFMALVARVLHGVAPIQDTVTFADPADKTKGVRLDAGNVTAGQTRVLTMANSNLDLANVPRVDVAQSFSQSQKGQVLSNIGSAWELIGTANPSGAASVDFTDLSAYRALRLSGYVITSAATDSLILRTSDDNGATYNATAGDYRWATSVGYASTTVGAGSSASNHMRLATDVGQNTIAARFTAEVGEFNKAANSVVSGFVGFFTTIPVAGVFMGRRDSATAQNALRLMFVTGTITGHVMLEGVRG